MADSLISRPGKEFLLDLQAQLERADRSLAMIADEFNKTSPGSDFSRAGRIETKEFISTIKYVLDQLTVRVWTTLVAPELPPETAAKRTGVIYYPYASDEQMFRSALGKMVNIKSFDTDTQTPGEEMFAAWLRATQPIHPTPYGALYTIGCLSRLPHRKLIDQRKSCLFLVEAFGPEGGGASMRFKNKPGRFTLSIQTRWTSTQFPERELRFKSQWSATWRTWSSMRSHCFMARSGQQCRSSESAHSLFTPLPRAGRGAQPIVPADGLRPPLNSNVMS